jgi:peptidoglycan/xylan/chitin deacetylase (PgdA/CDA1 family)
MDILNNCRSVTIACTLFCCLIFFGSCRSSTSQAKPAESGKTSISDASINANELGKVPILEYHLIQPAKNQWAKTADEFRHDLELLYDSGYRSISLSDFIQGKIDLPAGTHPVIFTFDDSSPGQFRYLGKNGAKTIDPDCAVGIFQEFKKRRPDFGMHATFFVLPGAKEPNKLFGQPEYEMEKLKALVALGFEIGNHTLWHANLKKFSDDVIQQQLATAIQAIQKAIPGYKVNTLALPYGIYPKDIELAIHGAYKGFPYHNDAILEVSGGSSKSPFNASWDPVHLPRVEANGNEVKRTVDFFKKNPDKIFVSDGNPGAVTYPAGLKSELNASRFKNLHYRAY